MQYAGQTTAIKRDRLRKRLDRGKGCLLWLGCFRYLTLIRGMDRGGSVAFDPGTTRDTRQRAQPTEWDSDDMEGRHPDQTKVKPKRQTMDVVDVILNLADDTGKVRVRRQIYLGQTRQTGSYAKAFAVTWNLTLQVRHEFWSFRSRADQAHVAAQHIPQLRQFVEMREAQKPCPLVLPVHLPVSTNAPRNGIHSCASSSGP